MTRRGDELEKQQKQNDIKRYKILQYVRQENKTNKQKAALNPQEVN